MNPHSATPRSFSLLIILVLLVGSTLAVKPVIAADTIMVINLNDSGAGSLRQAIEDISLNGTITFDPSLSGQITLSSPLAINENLTIDGSALAEPITISGNDNIRVFEVSSSVTDAILKSLMISNGNSSNDPGASGGAIKNIGHLTLINCTFNDHQTDGNGGAIENFSESTLIVENSRFYHNQSKYHGGAIANYGTMIISNSIFSDNHSTDLYGGGIANFADLEISASSFLDNSAYVLGGGLYNTSAGNLTLITSTLSGNRTVHNYMPSGGGVYNAGNLSMINSTLSENIVDGMIAVGGGIYNSGSLMLTNSTLSGNIAKGANAYGGGIINHGSLKYTHTIITDSFGGNCVNQGTIHPDSTHNMVRYSNCNVMTNLPGDPLLGPLADNGGPTLTHTLLPGSPAIDSGSGAHCPHFDQRGIPRPQGAACDIGAFEVEQILVTNNNDKDVGSLRQAIDDISPGGIITFWENDTITLDNRLPIITSSITIIGNGAVSTIIQASECNPVTLEPAGCEPAGYNVFEVASSGSLTLDGVTVRHGNAYSGGAILNEGTLHVTNSTISANKAQTYGGGIFNANSDAITTVANSIFSGNTTNDNGGGISNLSGILTVTSSTFSNNGAQIRGGGISNIFGTATVTNSTFSENYADDGGGISNPYGTLTVTGSSFTENLAVTGGGTSNPYGTMTVTSSTFTDNYVFNIGGGLINSGSLEITDSPVLSNQANNNGGGVYNSGSLKITGSTISGNNASVKGGGVFNNGILEIDQSTFLANDAELGGGIRNDEGVTSKISVTDSTFRENTAAHGGAIDNWGDGPNLVNTSSLIENSATASGGAIRNWSNLTVENSTISGNTALGVGGGLNNQEPGLLTLHHVTFNQNEASSGGGIHIGSNTTLTFIRTIIAGSTYGDCVNIGGTIHADSSHNLVEDGSCQVGNSSNISGDPLLGPLANNGGPTWNHGFVSPESPAIDAGALAHCPSTDQRGYDRPIDGNSDGVAGCDIGAFEYDPTRDGVKKIFLPLILR